MNTNIQAAVAQLSDADLLSGVELLAAREREATVELLAHLAELDTRRIYLAVGYGSLFSYCTAALGLSEHAAYNRIEAARAARRFPTILDLLASGSVNLTMVRLLAPHLTGDNHREVLAEATGGSKRDIEALIARLAPRPDVPASVRKLPAFPPAHALPEPPAAPASPGMQTSPSPGVQTSGVTPRPAIHPPVVAPLAPERYRVQFTVGKGTHEKLRLAQELLRREIPDGDPGAIFDRALTLLLEDVAKKKLAATSKPRPGRQTASGSRHIPAEVRRTVWLRDGSRCGFIGRNGRRCTERAFLDRGRDAGFPAPPAQIRACAASALGSCLRY